MELAANILAVVLGIHAFGALVIMVIWAVFTEINRHKFIDTLTLEERDLIRRYNNIPFWKVQK